MSFFYKVAGLTNLPVLATGGVDLDNLNFEGLVIECANYANDLVLCPGPGSGTDTFSGAVSGFFDDTADYFAVNVYVNGPWLRGASCHDPSGPGDSPCTDGGPSYYDGTVSGGDYVIRQAGEAVAVPATYSADWADEGHDGFAFTWWPNRYYGAYLVNPSPVWPIPDAFGNTFGQCLHTLAQLPASIETVIDHYNYSMPIKGRLRIGVLAYVEGDPPAEGYPSQYIIGGV